MSDVTSSEILENALFNINTAKKLAVVSDNTTALIILSAAYDQVSEVLCRIEDANDAIDAIVEVEG